MCLQALPSHLSMALQGTGCEPPSQRLGIAGLKVGTVLPPAVGRPSQAPGLNSGQTSQREKERVRRTKTCLKHRARWREGPAASDEVSRDRMCAAMGETERFPERRERNMVLQIWIFDQTQFKMNGKRCVSDTLVKCLTPNTRKQPKSFQRVWHLTSLSQSTYLKTVQPTLESLRKVDYQADGD